jgi:predicted Zn-dependent peptidase
VRGLNRKDLQRHRDTARNRVPVAVVAAGRVDHATVVAQVRRRFGLRSRSAASPASPRVALERVAGRFQPRHLSRAKEVQQATVLLGGAAYAWNSPMRYPVLLLHCALGDGMSSKLFQNLRETHGLVYNIGSNPEFLSREGLFTIGFATEPKNLAKAVAEIGRELAKLRKTGLTARELEFAKKNVCGGILLGLESTNTRMAALARRLLGGDAEETLERIVTRIQAVTPAQVRECAREVLCPDQWAAAAVLPKNCRVDLAALLAKA